MIINYKFINITLRAAMKDLPHHVKKLNRKVIRSMHREEVQEKEMLNIPTWTESKEEKRKKNKRAQKAERKSHVASHKSPEERNKEMKSGRVPVIEKNNATPTHNPPSRKKSPPI